MEIVYVADSNHVTITCPKCGLKKNADVTNFKDTHKRLKAKCKCGEVFRLSLDFRKYLRKNILLTGEYYLPEKDEQGQVIIEDISTNGINFATLKPHNFSKNESVELKLTFDDLIGTEIHTFVKIKWISDRNVGAQFTNPKSLEKDLGFYMRK